MRLIDLVMQAPQLETTFEGGREGPPVLGAGAFSDALRECPLRYVMDRVASGQCGELVHAMDSFPDCDDPLVRLPLRRFWLELYSSGDGEEEQPHMPASGRKLGYLVEADEDGRSGRITCFAQDQWGKGRLLGGTVLFDFDRPLSRHAGDVERYPLRHGTLSAANRLLRTTLLEVRKDWSAAARASGRPYGENLAKLAELMWSALPVVLSFSALLNARTALSERKSDLTVLNLARTKKGQVPLLDHVEITLRLAGGSGEARRHGGGGSERRVPRLHIVRGHQFRRAGAVYWRASHFRGSGIEVPVTTVSVKGANSADGRSPPRWNALLGQSFTNAGPGK